MNIVYYHNLPAFMDGGGGGKVIKEIVTRLSQSHSIKPLDTSSETIDFEVCIVFGCTYMNFEINRFLRSKGVKVIVFPIFDRLKPVWQMKLFKWMTYFPVHNSYRERRDLFMHCDHIIVANESEKRDIASLYQADKNKISVMHYCLSDDFFAKADSISPLLFSEKYPGWHDFVFCPASRIYPRKNQKKLLEALKDTDIKLVLNNTHIIDGYDEKEIQTLLDMPNVLCLERMSEEGMISCYKNAKVAISVSQAETAGLVNLEALYCECNVVVSDLEALREYLGDHAQFINQNSVSSIKDTVSQSLKTEYNQNSKQFILENYTWGGFIDELEKIIHSTY